MQPIHIQDTIRNLLERTLAGEDVQGAKELKNLSYFDIAVYAKERKFKYSFKDIGRSQKADLIKSIVKHNT